MERALLEEYERFGPWIDEVRTPDEVPRLFRGQGVDPAAARLVLKVPRDVPRRDVSPGMDLYDHLLVLGEDLLTVLSRRPGGSPAAREVPLDQVTAVRDSVDLLEGRLTVRTADGAEVRIGYNGAARGNVERLVDLLRASLADPRRDRSRAGLALAAAGRAEARTCRLDSLVDDLALAADTREAVRRAPGLEVWACHGRSRLAPRAGGPAGAVRAALHAISPAMLQAAVLTGDDAVLEVLGRSVWLARGKRPVHSASRLVLPLTFGRVALREHPAYPGALTAVVDDGVELVVPAGSPAHRVLAAAADAR